MVSYQPEIQVEETKLTFAEYEKEVERERIRKILESAQNTINSIGNTIQKTEKVQAQLSNIQKGVKEVLQKENAIKQRAAQLDAMVRQKYGDNAVDQATAFVRASAAKKSVSPKRKAAVKPTGALWK